MNRLRCLKLIHFATVIVSINVHICHAQSIPVRDAEGFQQHPEDKIALGQLLFFDKILSGNKNISCASCHHPLSGTADGLPLGIGEGGRGMGQSRNLEGVEASAFDIKKRIPRNAPALFNLGHKDFKTMFHDGRVQGNYRHISGFTTPAKDDTPRGLDSALAAQALFPVTSAEEMAGAPGTNSIADAAAEQNFPLIWDILTKRIQTIPEYVSLFQRAYPGQISSAGQITIVHIANAIAAFESDTWRADNSPFDRFMAGNGDCVSKDAREGMVLFLGKGRCSSCHSGKWQTDHRFHSIAMPQIGPGKGDGTDGNHDFGRERVSGRETDRYKFRTPSLRNVALTAPYGHCGAFPDLKSVIRHHLNPAKSLTSFDPSTTRVPQTNSLTGHDMALMQNTNELRNMVNSSEIGQIPLTDEEVDKIIEFLYCLTDPRAFNMLHQVPYRVPSGLPIFD
ncbi:MAG: cytochrome c peroxidase [Verrucomicrobiales bacterium]|nr:cytochrome c peroxidase [Verrucomicrobiales bacterium]